MSKQKKDLVNVVFSDTVRVKKIIKKGEATGKWQMVVSYWDKRECESSPDAPVLAKKTWHTITKLSTQTCYSDSEGTRANRGKKAAQDEAKAWLEELKRGNDERTRPYGKTVHDHTLAGIEAKLTKRGGEPLAPHTQDDYMRCLRYIDGGDFPSNPRPNQTVRHIDGIGSIMVEDLSRADISNWVEQLQKAGYSAQTVKKALFVLRSIGLAHALDKDEITANPAVGIEVPDPEAREVTYLDNASMRRLLTYLEANSDRYTLAIRTALFTGMREAEVCGIKWGDVDFAAGLISVKRVIAHTGNTFIVREKPKSKKSRRAIPLDHELAEELLSLRKSLTDILDHMSDLERHEAIKDMYVFGNPTPRKGESEYMNPRVLYKAWRRLVDKLDLQTANGMSPKFHDLRHTFATIWANSENNDIGTLTKVLGHSDESVTRKYYINIEEETLRRGVNGVSSAIRSRGAQADVIEFEKTGTEDR